jgi:hypothetical protein
LSIHQKGETLQNALTNHDRITQVIEHAVVRGSGYAASEAASTIDKEFILIKKSDLPPVQPYKFSWSDTATLKARTASYHKGSPETYWNRALDFISVALHAEQEEAAQANRELEGMRKDAYAMLYPSAPPLWDYESAESQLKTKIDVVVGLMKQVDELKKTK